MRRLLRSRPLICRIDVTAFVSVMLALVMTFLGPIIARPDLPNHGVDLAKTVGPSLLTSTNREDAINISVERDGNIYFRDEKMPLPFLRQKIGDQLKLGAERKIYFRADARARYGAVLDALKAVQASGIEDIAFITEKRGPIGHGM